MTSGLGRNWSLPEGEQMGGKQHRQQQKRREGVKEDDLLRLVLECLQSQVKVCEETAKKTLQLRPCCGV